MTNDSSSRNAALRLLGLSEGASQKDIARAYKQRARALRPNVTRGDPEQEGLLRKITDAFQTLGGTLPPEREPIVFTPARMRGTEEPAAEPPKRPRLNLSLSRTGVVAMAIIAGVLAMIIGYAEKLPCNPPRVWDGFQYRHNCYSDILPLYGARPEPFQEGERKTSFAEHGLAYRDNWLEYPALTGLFISTVNAPVKNNNPAGFLSANAFGLSLFALAGIAALALIARRPERLLLYAFAPAMIAYAFHNWDLIPVGLIGIGFWAYTRNKDGLAGAMIGLGAAAKVFPGLALPALALARRREGKAMGPLVISTILWFAIPNAIVLAYAGIDGWWFPWGFQSTRLPNFETVWYFVLHHGQGWWDFGNDFWFGGDYARVAQLASTMMFGVFSLLLLWRESKREQFRPITTAFGIVILFLMTAKVFSPQYAIWLLPFFVLVRVPWHAFVAYVVGDLLALTAVWTYFTAFADNTAAGWHFAFLEFAVYLRYATLGYVLYWTRKAEDLNGDAAPVVIGPASTLWPDQRVAMPMRQNEPSGGAPA